MILRILVISGEYKKGERDGFLVSQPRGCSVLLRLRSNDLGSDKTDTPYSLSRGPAARSFCNRILFLAAKRVCLSTEISVVSFEDKTY